MTDAARELPEGPPSAVPSATRDGRSARWEDHRTRQRIALVDATIRAIRHQGSGVGMDEIAHEAGTSKTVIYRHFGDKAGLYRAVAERINDRVLRHVSRALDQLDAGARPDAAGSPAPQSPAPPPAEDVIASTIDAYLTLVESDPEVYRFVVRRPLVDAPLSDDPVEGAFAQVAARLESALTGTNPTTAPPRARVWSIALVGSVQAVADDWLNVTSRRPRAELVNELTTLSLHGLAALPAPIPPTASTNSGTD